MLAIRASQQRNFLATLLLSQGVPMIAHGDELGRTQQGNNNTYAQDSEISWMHWDDADEGLIEFTAAVAALRAEHPTFRRIRFFNGRPVTRDAGEPLPDIEWLGPDGAPMTDDDWDADFVKAATAFLNGQGIRGRDARGNRMTDANVLLLFNASEVDVNFSLPPAEYAASWTVEVDTADIGAETLGRNLESGAGLTLTSRSMMVLVAAS